MGSALCKIIGIDSLAKPIDGCKLTILALSVTEISYEKIETPSIITSKGYFPAISTGEMKYSHEHLLLSHFASAIAPANRHDMSVVLKSSSRLNSKTGEIP